MTSNPNIRILLVDDHTLVRKGLRTLLEHTLGVEVIGEGANGLQAIELFNQTNPDVILMDINMPEMDGVTAIGQILDLDPEARIIILTSLPSDDKVFPALKAGAIGYVLKHSEPAALFKAIHQAYMGESFIDPMIARKIIAEFSHSHRPQKSQQSLTERENSVLSLVAKGLSNQNIADKLSIAESTVRTHVTRILDKLHLENRVQATLYALRKNITTLDPD